MRKKGQQKQKIIAIRTIGNQKDGGCGLAWMKR